MPSNLLAGYCKSPAERPCRPEIAHGCKSTEFMSAQKPVTCSQSPFHLSPKQILIEKRNYKRKALSFHLWQLYQHKFCLFATVCCVQTHLFNISNKKSMMPNNPFSLQKLHRNIDKYSRCVCAQS